MQARWGIVDFPGPDSRREAMIEIEVKLAIGPLEPEARRLGQLGALLVHPRSLEDNVLLDLGEGRLRARGAMLRVRKYGGQATLTYKEPGPEAEPAGYKVRREMETAIDDADALIGILSAAGFRRVWRYEKYRTVYQLEGVQALLDETPIGNFLELEGSRESIDSLSHRLGRTSADYIASSYQALQERWCRDRGLLQGDMVFERGSKQE